MLKKLGLIFYLAVFIFSQASQASFQSKIRINANVTSGEMQFNTQGSVGFTETQIGLSYPISSFAEVQASGLVRFASGGEKYFGGQITLPVTTAPIVDSSLLQAHLAPGFRIMRGYEALLIEGGLSSNYTGIGVGVGYRLILNELFDNGLNDESQIFFYSTFSGIFN